MIPKVIHYCWFGGNPLPPLAEKCVASWRKYLSDYEIRRWDETNFDVEAHPYTRDAYAAGLYAFVSDYARFKILFEHGGVYFDTDVEVIRPLDDVISAGPFMGFESDGLSSQVAVNPGLGLAATPSMSIYREILLEYDRIPFFDSQGNRNPYSMIPMVTELLVSKGLKGGVGIENVAGVNVYPQEWFNPFEDSTGRLNTTENTRTIHWYSKSWMPKENSIMLWAKRMARRLFGVDVVARLGRVVK